LKSDAFGKRIRRAEQLEKDWPFAADLLRFFATMTSLQRDLAAQRGAAPPDPEVLSRLLRIVREQGPAVLAESARQIDVDTLADLDLSETAWQSPPEDPAGRLFLWVLGQVQVADAFAEKLRASSAKDSPGLCPLCRLAPLVSVLREDKLADTLRRTLLCPRCSREWDYPRVLCPSCKEERPEKLPRYTAQEIPWMRVEACDSCGKYLKSVDLTQNWDAEPVVDELASTPLDVIAREHGYTKIAPNLAGL
jgi:FdhE protein